MFRCLRFVPVVTFRHARLATWWGWCPFHGGTFTRKIDAAYLGALPKTTIHASPEFLNRLDWQLRRLLLLIEVVEGNAVSLGELHEALHSLLEEAQSKK